MISKGGANANKLIADFLANERMDYRLVSFEGGKVTNVKKVTATVKNNNVKTLKLKAKKSVTVTAKVTAQNKKLTLKKHRVVKYESSNTKIATVSKKGKVTAKKKGTCYIYAYSQNGVYAKVKVTVK